MKKRDIPWVKGLIYVFLLITLIVGYRVVYPKFTDEPLPDPDRVIETYEECAAAGYPILDSYPEQCEAPDGRRFTRVTPVDEVTDAVLSGTHTCLPKKDTGGPITLECAFGLEANGEYYALDMSSIRSDDYPFIDTGDRITVYGILVPIEMISSDRFATYDVVGVIAVNKVEKE